MVQTLLSAVAVGVLLGAHTHGQTAAQSAGTTAARAAAVVNLNTATAAELQELPGIGAATAARILEYRQKNGSFKKIEELMNVQGVGEKTFLRLKPQITVAPKPPAPAVSQD
jgi:competence protein ComEA